jgi:CTP:molybdopterin cytidylyltransferase MocA
VDATVAVGLVLAAGRSRRMGSDKALLQVAGETFLARAVRVLFEGGGTAVLAVVPAVADPVAREAERVGARAVPGAPAGTPIDSLRCGIAALAPDAGGALVLPVDCVDVGPDTVRAVLRAAADGAAFAVPSVAGAPGHPVWIARARFGALQGAAPHGLRSVLDAHAHEVVRVEVADAGALSDVDTPAELERLAARAASRGGPA